MKPRFLAAIVLLAVSLCCHADQPRFTVVPVDTRTQKLELFLYDDRGAPFNNFERLEEWLQARGQRLRFGMNAGMFQPDFSPVGLYVAGGKQLAPLNLHNGSGNFSMKPNGVFYVNADGPGIVESSRYPALAAGVRLATQSGPLLLEHNQIHPGFDPASKSLHIRNGVGVAGPLAYFVISNQPVSFYELAVYFRDQLHCPDALYLDGSVSALYAPDLDREDTPVDLGPIIGVVGEPPP